MRLVIADPSLVDTRGHHYTLTLMISYGARLNGLDVVWFTHKDFNARDLQEDIEVYSIFSVTMYDRYKPEKKDKIAENLDKKILNELDKGINDIGMKKDEHIYFHTGFGDVFLAVESFIDSGWKSKPYLHICTPYDLDTMPGRDSGDALANFFLNLRFCEAVDKKVFFWAETPQLAQHYTITYGFNTRALPLPSSPSIRYGEGIEKKSRNNGVSVLYLGAAREEKGFTLLPDLVESLYDDYGKTGKLKFIIQCTPQIIGYLPIIKKAINRLADYPSSYVELIEETLSEDDYHNFLISSDVILLLYNKKNYKIRGSGIAVEAVCSNKCILTFKETFCESLLTHGGGEAVTNLEDAICKLALMIDKRNVYHQKAKCQGRHYRSLYNVEKYVARLINQVSAKNDVLFFPSSIVGYISPLLLKLEN